jgi:hypothetical protein
MTNGDVKDITVTSASAIGFGTGCVFSGPPVDIPQGQSAIISITACSPAVNPDKIKSDLVITYTSGSPVLTKTITGEIYSRVN